MTIIHSLILGIVEGITEFLPISSTAHLALVSNFILRIPTTEFSKSFDIIIQLGAILAVLSLYWKKFLDWEVIKRLFVAFVPTAIIGLIFYKLVKGFFLESYMVIIWSLIIGGCLLMVFELFHKEKLLASDEIKKISYKKCLLIGLFQSLAIVPGVSRAAATIVGGLILGLKRRAIVEFSFLLAVPTMAAATALDIYKSVHNFTKHESGLLLIGFLTSFVVAIGAIKFLLQYIQKRDFKPFAIYRIVIGLFFLWLLFV
jgi:undecaprenyl-diphosphatase